MYLLLRVILLHFSGPWICREIIYFIIFYFILLHYFFYFIIIFQGPGKALKYGAPLAAAGMLYKGKVSSYHK